MLEQQLINYIKSARDAGQTDEQTKSLLFKNGWTEGEVAEAFSSLDQTGSKLGSSSLDNEVSIKYQPEPEPQPELKPEPEPEPQPEKVQISQQPKPTYQPSFDHEEMPLERSPHMLLKVLIALFVVIILAVAGYFVAGQFISIPWDPFRANPETVVNKMLGSLKDVKAYHTNTQGEINLTDEKKVSQGKLAFKIESKIDTTNTTNPKASFDFLIDFTMAGSPQQFFSANGSMIIIGSTSYSKLNSITLPAGFSYPGLDISKITGKWYKIDQDSINAMALASSGQATLPEVIQVNNSAFVNKVQNIVSTENLLSFSKQFADQTISGNRTYHYSLVISKDKMKDLVSKLIVLDMQESLKAQGDNPAVDTGAIEAMAKSFVGTIIDAIGDINIETWIGKKDSMLYGLKFDKTIDFNKIYPEANMQLAVKIDTINSDFNKPIAIEPPADSQKIEGDLLPLLRTQRIESSVREIEVIAQTLYTTSKSYSSLCSKGLLNGYLKNGGSDLIALNNTIVNQGAAKPACFAGAKDFCISVQLAGGSYLCVDETGATGTTRCLAATTACK